MNPTIPDTVPENEREETIFEPQDEILKGQEGWLSPEGEFYPCKSTEHDDCAISIFKGKEEEFSSRSRRLDPRNALKLEGYYLLTGNIAYMEGTFELTPGQVSLLQKADILVVDSIRNIECSSRVLSETIFNIRKGVDSVKESKGYKKTWDLLNGYLKKYPHLKGLSMEELLEGMNWGPDFASVGERLAVLSIISIEAFYESPLTETLELSFSWAPKSQYKELPNAFFNELSAGSIETLTFKEVEENRSTFTFALVPTEDPDIYLFVSKEKYNHDVGRESAGLEGDYRYKIYARLVDTVGIREQLNKIVQKIEVEGHSGDTNFLDFLQ